MHLFKRILEELGFFEGFEEGKRKAKGFSSEDNEEKAPTAVVTMSGWSYAFRFADRIYWVEGESALSRFETIVGYYGLCEAEQEVSVYCTYGEKPLHAGNEEEVLTLEERYLMFTLPMSSLTLLWQMNHLSFHSCISVYKQAWDSLPEMVAERLRMSSVKETSTELIGPGQAITDENISRILASEEDIDTFCETLKGITDDDVFKEAVESLIGRVNPDNVRVGVRMVDALISSESANPYRPEGLSEKERALYLKDREVDEINPLENLYCSVYLWWTKLRIGEVDAEMNRLREEIGELGKILPDRPEPLWAIHKMDLLQSEKRNLSEVFDCYQQVYQRILSTYLVHSHSERLERFQGLCGGSLDETRIRLLSELILNDENDEAILQKMASLILETDWVNNFPAEAQYLTGRLLIALEQVTKVNDLMSLDRLQGRIGTLDYISRLYLLTEQAVMPHLLNETERRVKELRLSIADGKIPPHEVEQRKLTLVEDEETLGILTDRAERLSQLVQEMNRGAVELDASLCGLLRQCVEEGPLVRLQKATGEEMTAFRSLGLGRLYDKAASERSDEKVGLLYEVVSELSRLMEPMEKRGFSLMGYGYEARNKGVPSQAEDQYVRFLKELTGEEIADLVYPVFVSGDRKYANRYDWLQGFTEEPSDGERERALITLSHLKDRDINYAMKVYQSPDDYARLGGHYLARWGILSTLAWIQDTDRSLVRSKKTAETLMLEIELKRRASFLYGEAARVLKAQHVTN